MQKRHLAIDIGANGGILLVGSFQNKTLESLEGFRSSNSMKQSDNGIILDIGYFINRIHESIQVEC